MSTLFVDTINEKTNGNGIYIPGHIVQIKQTVDDTQVTVTGTTFTDVLSVSITPSSTSSKILVLTDVALSLTSAHGTARLLRDSANIYFGSSAGSRQEGFASLYAGSGTDDSYSIRRYAIQYLDSPATTSSVTYKVQTRGAGSTGYTIYMNRSGLDGNSAFYTYTASSITVMEIGG